jgi:hypothetical protein
MGDSDAAARALTELVMGAEDFGFTLEGRAFTVTFGPAELTDDVNERVLEVADVESWPLNRRCNVTWPGGSTELWLGATHYRHRSGLPPVLALFLAHSSTQVLWCDVSTPLNKDPSTDLEGGLSVESQPDPAAHRARQTKLVGELGLPLPSSRNVKLGQFKDGVWATPPQEVARRIVQTAVLKLPYFAIKTKSPSVRYEGAPPFAVDGHITNPPPPKAHTDLLHHLQATSCVVLQGPPGTGKTYAAEQLIKGLAGGKKKARALQLTRLIAKKDGDLDALLDDPKLAEHPVVWELVQMHPGYSYDDFVRGQVTQEGEGLHFVSADRIVVQMARVAQKRPGKPTLLILDEINRCNLASVLGELILVLERSKRGKGHPVRLQYAAPPEQPRDNDLLWLPCDLWLLGTMNTADRSIALVDYAIRRRFRFLDVLPDAGAIAGFYDDPTAAEAAARLFETIGSDVVADPNLQVGHSYFMTNNEDWARDLADKFLYEVVPLLREYHAERKLKDTVSGLAFDSFTVPLDRPEPVAKYVQPLIDWLTG